MPPRIAITAKTEALRNRPQTTIPVAYAKAIEEAGGIPFIVPILDSKTNIVLIAHLADGLLLSGGDDIHPKYYGEGPLLELSLSPDERTDFEIALLKEVMSLQKPVLGICLGAQLINVALGGSLYQDIPMQITNPINHRTPHNVSIIEGTLLYRIFNGGKGGLKAVGWAPPTKKAGDGGQCPPYAGFSGETIEIHVLSAHHQTVKSAGKGLVVSAQSPDGVIEAIEMPDYPFLLGVQWHPERELENKHTKMLFNAFVEAAGKSSRRL